MKFYQHFRMPTQQFKYLLQKIEKGLKKNTTFRGAKSTVDKLATCLGEVHFKLILFHSKGIY